MGRQFRSPRRGASQGGVGMSVTYPAIVTSSSTAIAIPNYGLTDISGWAAGEYVLDAPELGSRKTIVSASSSSLARVIRFSTGVTVSGGTLATTAGTQVTFNATVDMCLVLVGLNSTHWVFESMYPPMTSNSTGIVLAGS